MPLRENPPSNERSRTDRLGRTPTLIWGILGILLVLIFVGLLFLIGQHHVAVAAG